MNLSRPCFDLQALRLSKKKSSALARSVAEKGGRPDKPYTHTPHVNTHAEEHNEMQATCFAGVLLETLHSCREAA
jgi:hypothetical protein